MARGGLPCTVLTIQRLTGVKSIPFAAVLKFNGVVAMSNAIGGVPVCVGGKGIHDSTYTDLNLEPGTRWLKGKQAAEFLRTRHGVGDASDLGRISNQMVFLSSLVRQIKTAGTLTNPVKVWGLAKAVLSNIYPSEQLDNLTTLYQIAMALKDLSMNNVSFVQYPTVEDPQNTNHVVPDQDAANVLFDAIAKDQPISITGGTGDGDQASIVKNPTAGPTSSSTPTKSTSSSSPSGSGGGNAVPGTTKGAAVQLPNSIHGQTAATETCSNGAG